jgi:hypothetical protein
LVADGTSFVPILFTCLMLGQGAWFAPEGAKIFRTEKTTGISFNFDTISRNFDSVPVLGNPSGEEYRILQSDVLLSRGLHAHDISVFSSARWETKAPFLCFLGTVMHS